MKRITIIGAGLIGGSLGMALKGRGYRITAVGRDKVKLASALRRKAADQTTTDQSEGVSSADIVVIATPVDRIVPVFRAVLPHLKKGAVVTDVGSTKAAVIAGALKAMKSSGRDDVRFVGSHPMAGSEKTGIHAAEKRLFERATSAVCGKKTDPAVKLIAGMWSKAGANILYITPEEHDKIVSFTSHLPHIVAFALCSVAGKNGSGLKRVTDLSAGSFRDATRVAASDPSSWSAICSSNAGNLRREIGTFIRELTAVKRKLNDAGPLNAYFSRARKVRDGLDRSGRK